VSWYRTTVNLNLPKGQDTSVGLKITDDPSRHYPALIFVNGWQPGRYVNDVGPQHDFPIPNGILKAQSRNTIAIAVWNTDASAGGLGTVQLESFGSPASSQQVGAVARPPTGRDTRARRPVSDSTPALLAMNARTYPRTARTRDSRSRGSGRVARARPSTTQDRGPATRSQIDDNQKNSASCNRKPLGRRATTPHADDHHRRERDRPNHDQPEAAHEA
jgi:hypothetical protein